MAETGNLVQETSTSTGTGNLTLTNVDARQSFNEVFGNGATTDVFWYFITHRSADEWEYGTGHMSDATTLVRDTVVESSNADAAVSFSAGTKDITSDRPADYITTLDQLTDIITSSDSVPINDASATQNKYIEATKVGGRHLLATGTASGASTLDFDLRDYLGYHRYSIELSNIVPSADGTIFYMRTSSTASPTALSFDSGASDYSWHWHYSTSGGTNSTYTDVADSEVHLLDDIGTATGESGWYCDVEFRDPTNYPDYGWFTFRGGAISSAGSAYLISNGQGYRNATSNIEGVRFLLSTGTFSCKYRLYGEM